MRCFVVCFSSTPPTSGEADYRCFDTLGAGSLPGWESLLRSYSPPTSSTERENRGQLLQLAAQLSTYTATGVVSASALPWGSKVGMDGPSVIPGSAGGSFPVPYPAGGDREKTLECSGAARHSVEQLGDRIPREGPRSVTASASFPSGQPPAVGSDVLEGDELASIRALY